MRHGLCVLIPFGLITVQNGTCIKQNGKRYNGGVCFVLFVCLFATVFLPFLYVGFLSSISRLFYKSVLKMRS